MSDELKHRLRAVMPDHVDRAAGPFDPQADQTWYADRDETVSDIEDGGAIIGSASCDMTELLELAESRGWSIKFEAGGVYNIRPE